MQQRSKEENKTSTKRREAKDVVKEKEKCSVLQTCD
jgi:hypothetical protein